MNNQTLQHSQAWVFFTYASFILSLLMIGGGIALMPIDLWMKGFLGMGIMLLVQSCITLTKTMRDSQEALSLVNRIEDAKTERLL
ncbi:MAG: YiaA/YiaB family inner membrane protein, partial [Methylocella sp.]